ncbi:MAG: signal peptide peptidase SppA [Candidatus Saganbacteria bacterium]|nr:signal peptide peptidase SppA [Candidatus Saganbacteria bacterium]
MKRFVAAFFFTLLCITPSLSQNIVDLSLKRGFGVRATGMGGAYTAVADDGSAVFYNPAGLAVPSFCYTYGDPDTEKKVLSGTFTFAKLAYIGYGSWTMRETASDEVSATVVGFGNKSSWLNWGMNFKSLNWNVSGVENSGWSSDIGFLMRISPQLNLGLLAQDLLTSQNSITATTGRLGIDYRPFGDRMILASDLEFGQRPYGHLGIEANIVKGLTMRAGIDRSDPTLGLTLDLWLFSVDYSVLFGQKGNTIHGLELGVGVAPKQERPFSIIKPKEYALIDVSGAVKGGRTEVSFLGGVKPGLDSILSEIRRATKDKGIDGIMLRLGGFGGGLGGMAIVQEIRYELERARKSGKKIVAYVEGSALGDEYYLAACADKIVAPPGAAIGGFGKSLAVYRLKGLFEKIGIEWQIFTQGKYKGAFDPFKETFSKDQEEMAKNIVADLYRQMLTDIAKDRNMKLEKIKEIGDGMIFPARLAQKMGLVDEIGYYSDARKLAAEISGSENKEAQIIEPRLVEPQQVFLTKVFGVAVIEIDGEIVSGKGGENIIFGGRYVGSDTIAKYIRKASDDIFVKAIILRINSPGGDAIASGEIYEALKYAKEKKKVLVASIGSIGASGGYYIAVGADKIVADPASITGSIGVIGQLPVIAGLLKKLDIGTDVIKEGKYSDMFMGLRKLSTPEVYAIERLQKENYDEFIQAVVAGRNLPTAEVEAAAQGQIFTGAKAKELKLVDKLGGFSDAVDLAIASAKIIGEPRLLFYHEPSMFFKFGEGMVESLGLKALPFLLNPSSSLLKSQYN